MRPADVLRYLNPSTFRPIRVHLTTREHFDIDKPQMADVSRSSLTIALEMQGSEQRFAEIALIHIVWIEVVVPVL